jgi:hypothetical protein
MGFDPCKRCGRAPVVRTTDISLIAVVCINPDCVAPVILACNFAIGLALWNRRQKGMKGVPDDSILMAHDISVHKYHPW